MNRETSLQPGVLTGLWQKLRRDASAEGRVAAADPAGVGDDFLLAVDVSGRPEILVLVEPTEKPPSDLSGRNVVVDGRSIGFKGRNRRAIALTCTDAGLETTFAELAVSIHGRIAHGQGNRRAVDRALRDFRRLLDRGPDRGQALEAIMGLAGELIVLERLTHLDPAAWESWNGPLGEIHDFRRGGRAIEVKSSSHPGENTITVSGLKQLEAPTDGLHLVRQVFVPDPEGRISVPNLVDLIEARCSHPEGFRHRLSEVGYSDATRGHWEVYRLELQSSTCYRVTDGFPRLTLSSLTRGELPSSVFGVSYQVALDSADPFRIAESELDQVFTDFISS